MRSIDLFAGSGGWDIAARECGYDPVGFEFDRYACETRKAVGLPTVQCDLSQYQFDIPEQVELFLASPPCQTFSSAGKNAGAKDWAYVEYALERAWKGQDYEDLRYLCRDRRSMLIVEPAKWIHSLEPIYVAMEQVPPALPLWEMYARNLQERGYCTWTGILSSETFGVPQTRRRAILLASKLGPVNPPSPTHSRYYSRDPKRYDLGVLPWVSMAEALGWGYSIRPMTTVCAHDPNSGFSQSGIEGGTGARQAQAQAMNEGNWIVKTRGELSRGGGASAGGTQFDSISRPSWAITHSVYWWERPASTIVGSRRQGDGIVIGRQLPPGEETDPSHGGWTMRRPATTIVGSFQPEIITAPGTQDRSSGGESRQTNGVRVTEQEASILQSFPPDYPWQGPKTHRFQQIGNAIPPVMAYHILRALLNPSPRPIY